MRELWRDETGLTSVEYALLMALVSVAGLASWQQMASAITESIVADTETISGTG